MTEMEIKMAKDAVVKTRYRNEITALAKSFEDQKPGALYDATAFATSCFNAIHSAYVDHAKGWCVEAMTTINMLYKYTVPAWSIEHAALDAVMANFAKIRGVTSSTFDEMTIDLIAEVEKVLSHGNQYIEDEEPMHEWWDVDGIQKLADSLYEQRDLREALDTYDLMLSIAVTAAALDTQKDADYIEKGKKMATILPPWAKEKRLIIYALALMDELEDEDMMANIYWGILFPRTETE